MPPVMPDERAIAGGRFGADCGISGERIARNRQAGEEGQVRLIDVAGTESSTLPMAVS
jgi:hypothetical protein